MVFRNEKTCREHWISHLDPTLNKYHSFKFIKFTYNFSFSRSSWTFQEDNILIKGFQIHNSKWSQIAGKLAGRNPYSVKNRFYSLCTRFGIQKNSTNLNEDLNKILHTLPVTKRIHTNEKINNFVHHNSESIAQNYNFQMNVPVGYYECVNPVYVMNFSTGNFTNFLIENFKYFLK